MLKTSSFVALMLLAGICAGCMPSIPEATPKSPRQSPPPPTATAPPVKLPPSDAGVPGGMIAPGMPGGIVTSGLPEGTVRPGNIPTQPPQQAPAPPALNAPTNMPQNPAQSVAGAVPAGVGVGAKGRSLDNESGVVVEAAKAFFNVRERVVFETAIPHAISLFEASEGRKPKSHDEFMTRIIAENNIQLPQLQPNRQYYYDPQQGQLMVVPQQRQ
jgi:hypothetical protein